MLSTIIAAPSDLTAERTAEAMARSLAALVSAAVEGIVANVTIAGPREAGLARLADHAGCAFVEGETPLAWLDAALAATRGERLFVLRAGRAPGAGFIEEIQDLPTSATALMRDAPEAFLHRLWPGLAPLAGVIIDRPRLGGAAPADLAGLARLARPARVLRTRARICL
jgi:hypothetical protein